MKTKLINLISKVTLLSAILLVTLAASAQGQTLQYRVKANIPFDFTVGDKALPAGKYSIGRTHRADDLVLSIADVRGRTKAIRLTTAALTKHPREKAALIFHRYGNQYFLFQVWPAGGEVGRQFPQSAQERAQRQIGKNSGTGNNTEYETVIVDVVLQ
jgi:hypothetical protein